MNKKNIGGFLQLRRNSSSQKNTEKERTRSSSRTPAEHLFTVNIEDVLFCALIEKGKINIIFPCLFQTINVRVWYAW